MFATPGTPNQADYTAFLYGIVAIPPKNLPTTGGSATAGTTTTLTDSTQTWTANQWQGYALNDVTQGLTGLIVSNTATTLTLIAALTLPIASGDAYLIAPPIVSTSLAAAQRVVNEQIACADADTYTWAVYNLAADRLINYAPDLPNQTYFADQRKKLEITSFAPGVTAASSNETTSVTLLNPEQLKTLTLRDLQFLKTDYGREYLGIAQSVGTLWGLS